MFYLYIKITAIIILITIELKFLTKIIPFNSNHCSINGVRKSAILSLIIIILQLIISIIYLLIIKKYFINVSQKESFFLQLIIYLLQLFPVFTIILFRKENISSLGITKNNLFKSIIIGIIIGITYFILVNSVFKVNKVMDIISADSFNSFISFFIVGFVEEVIFRGYLQTRLIYWLGTIKGYLLTSVIFSFFHIPNRLILGNLNFNSALISCIELILPSLLFGYIMLKTKNIFASSVFHTFVDWTETVIHIIG